MLEAQFLIVFIILTSKLFSKSAVSLNLFVYNSPKKQYARREEKEEQMRRAKPMLTRHYKSTSVALKACNLRE
ncbi:hypothetical protein I6F48_05920 [Pseudoalteromonas sp. SWYJ118]|uniref:hypothetical protein n=1 Tax=Pseudoalteromonas sp. SWYJ118 TaxID=2792062 RepID=UPI0018CDB389|nr:hypothetical protein [Pseudoalteromonas sp. SWYJ118]MBH0075105.1 hypothetical protein [Pseudoalteromonas sp. SWYJ118]